MNEPTEQAPSRLPGQFTPCLTSPVLRWNWEGASGGILNSLRVRSGRRGRKRKWRGLGAPVRRRRQGRKSPRNNSSAQEAAAGLGLRVGLAPWDGGVQTTSPPPQGAAWLGSRSNGVGGGEARCGNRFSRRPWVLEFRDAFPSNQGKPFFPAFWPGSGKLGTLSTAEGGAHLPGKRGSEETNAPQSLSAPIPVLSLPHWQPLQLKRKLLSRSSGC